MELADHLVTFAEEVDEYLREGYYRCLKMILSRGEFNLDNMGFPLSFSLFVNGSAYGINFTTNKKQDIGNLKAKLPVCLLYQTLSYKILERVLEKVGEPQQYFNREERSFVENYCAVSYFRIPSF